MTSVNEFEQNNVAPEDSLRLREQLYEHAGALAAAASRKRPEDDIPQHPDAYLPSMEIGRKDVTIRQLPELARPIAEFVRVQRPDAVIAADRGARLVGLAVFAAWRQMHPGHRFPTIDGKLHFAHLTRSKGYDGIQQAMHAALLRSGVHAEVQRRHTEDDRRAVNVMLLDDNIDQNRTMELITRALWEGYGFGVNPLIGSMMESRHRYANQIAGGSHNSAAHKRPVRWEWRDDSDIIGVRYIEDSPMPIPVRSARARKARAVLQQAMDHRYNPSPWRASLRQAKRNAKRQLSQSIYDSADDGER